MSSFLDHIYLLMLIMVDDDAADRCPSIDSFLSDDVKNFAFAFLDSS